MIPDGAPVGLVLGSLIPPERICGLARLGEELGYSELWLAEDYFLTGAISGAASVLASTQRIPVGLGIVSAVVRHPAVLAMECSTLARMHPGRFWPGIGLGLPFLIGQMGLKPKSQLAAVREATTAVRRLLAGEELTEEGQVFAFDQVKLAYPVAEIPLYLGVIGPKMLRLSGSIADGTIASVLATAEYVGWARKQIVAGQADAGRAGAPHRLAAFELMAVDRDGKKARDSLRPVVAFYLAFIASGAARILVEDYGIVPELLDMSERAHAAPDDPGADFPSAEAKAAALIAREMPDRWIDDLAVVGDPDRCAEQIRRLLAAGADSVVVFPTPADRTEEMMRLAAAEVFPRL